MSGFCTLQLEHFSDDNGSSLLMCPVLQQRESLYVPTESGSSQESSGSNFHADPTRPLDVLNNYLVRRDVSPVRYVLSKPWQLTTDKTRRTHTRKARLAVEAVISEIAPQDPVPLWHSVKEACTLSRTEDSEPADYVLMDALTECYKKATSWQTRRQILSVMVDKVTLPTLQRWIPELTRYRFNVAKRHLLLYGRGCDVPQKPIARMYVPPERLEHFLCFITSPHVIQELPFGETKMTLSTKETIIVPNVIRTLIPSRIVEQYQAICNETGFTPLSRTMLYKILRVCSASIRKSLQGLDYFSASEAKAIEDLQEIADKIGDSNSGLGMTWAKSQKEKLRLSKRYLKGDYKVSVKVLSLEYQFSCMGITCNP